MVKVQGELSDSFKTNKKLRQGDIISPFFSNLVLKSVIRRMLQQQGMKINENHTLLVYMDDIIIIGDMKQDIINNMYNENRQIYDR